MSCIINPSTECLPLIAVFSSTVIMLLVHHALCLIATQLLPSQPDSLLILLFHDFLSCTNCPVITPPTDILSSDNSYRVFNSLGFGARTSFPHFSIFVLNFLFIGYLQTTGKAPGKLKLKHKTHKLRVVSLNYKYKTYLRKHNIGTILNVDEDKTASKRSS